MTPPGDPLNYQRIVKLLAASFVILCAAILILNAAPVAQFLVGIFGAGPSYFLTLYCCGALGGLIAAYKFVANDKELNELEATREKPDPTALRYPTDIDVWLYGLRILFSGILGVVSGLLVLTGLVYFQVDTSAPALRQRLFMAVFAFVVGLRENDFLSFLTTLQRKLLRIGFKEPKAS